MKNTMIALALIMITAVTTHAKDLATENAPKPSMQATVYESGIPANVQRFTLKAAEYKATLLMKENSPALSTDMKNILFYTDGAIIIVWDANQQNPKWKMQYVRIKVADIAGKANVLTVR